MLSTEQSSPMTSDTRIKQSKAPAPETGCRRFLHGIKSPEEAEDSVSTSQAARPRSPGIQGIPLPLLWRPFPLPPSERSPPLRQSKKADRCTHGKPIIPLVFPPFRVPYTSLCRRFLLRLSLRRRCLYSLRIRVCFLRRALRRHHRLRAADRRFLRRLVK